MAAVFKPSIEIRAMHRRDLAEVLEIEQAAYPFPWSKGIFADCLRVGYCCRVVEADGRVAAYGIASMAVGEAHVLNLCVDPQHRRLGLGSLLLEALVLESRLQRARRMFLEVRPSNQPAIALYEKFGFRTIGRRPGYYPSAQGREDARVMVLGLETGRSS